MKRIFLYLIVLPAVCMIFSSIGSGQKIDRQSLVSRHNIENNSFDTLSSLSVGNGKFAFTVDATGLQTFPKLYKNGVCLGTQSEWGWHSFPDTAGFRMEETFQYFDSYGKKVPYAVQWSEPQQKKEAADYFRINPHRLHLGIIGFELLKNDNSPAEPKDFQAINQKLNLWEGLITSEFEIENEKIQVETVCNGEKDLIAASVISERIKSGKIGIKIRFPYPTGGFSDDGINWDNTEKHQSEIVKQNANDAVFIHKIDTTVYFLKITWTGKAEITEKEPHYFILKPAGNSNNFSFTAEFSSKNGFAETTYFRTIKSQATAFWKKYWTTGGAVDFSETTDPRAFELERRVILSQYLERVQCAGNFPPQETGLTYNSWYGKPHLEMHWWHGVHWAYWNRTELLEKSLNYYNVIFEKAEKKAEIQGYKGIRWQKMTDHSGNDSPSGVGEFLIWQQPHIIYFAELCYREKPDKTTLEKYSRLVFATAEFMADYGRFDSPRANVRLGPPLIPAQESLEKEKTFNPPFELAYWHWGLSVAQKWRERLGLPPDKNWQNIIDKIPPFAQKDGLFLAAESAPDSYSNPKYISDHPMVLGAFGLLPETVKTNPEVMNLTFDYVKKNWNWSKTWGWDYPMAAMCAVRLGKPEDAIDLLLMDVQKNTYLKNGHNYQDARLRIYLPGNGGILTTVAMMCAGYTGNNQPNSGFPKDWKVKWEDLKPVF
jgi:hypothetical protein